MHYARVPLTVTSNIRYVGELYLLASGRLQIDHGLFIPDMVEHIIMRNRYLFSEPNILANHRPY